MRVYRKERWILLEQNQKIEDESYRTGRERERERDYKIRREVCDQLPERQVRQRMCTALKR